MGISSGWQAVNINDVNNFWALPLKDMGRSSPSWWLECDVVLGQHSRDGGARRQKKKRISSSLCGTELLLLVRLCHVRSKSLRQCTVISHSWLCEWAGRGSFVWDTTLNSKQVFHQCFNTRVPAMWGGWQEWKGSLFGHIQLLRWLSTRELLCCWMWVKPRSTLVSSSYPGQRETGTQASGSSFP